MEQAERAQEPQSAPRYREAGVDLDRKGGLVRRLAALARSAGGAGVLEGVGGFAGLLALREAAPGVRDPVLVAGADGVGTKIALLAALGRHRVAGIDCVAMCVNDVVAAGGQPLFFLDYLAMGRLDEAVVAQVVEGIAEGCRQAGCALLGGETAEMPGFYEPGTYELAGFCVGVAERERVAPGPGGESGEGGLRARPGDVLIGMASSGLHANGFSLVRRILAESGAPLEGAVPWAAGAEPAGTLGEALTAPTRIYAGPVLALGAAVEVHALAHVTGGGLPDNVARILAPGCRAVIREGSWPRPPVFDWLQEAGGLSKAEMYRVFNMGIGMVAAVRPADAGAALAALAAAGQEAWVVGAVERAEEHQPAPLPGRLRFAPSAKHPEPGGWVEILAD